MTYDITNKKIKTFKDFSIQVDFEDNNDTIIEVNYNINNDFLLDVNEKNFKTQKSVQTDIIERNTCKQFNYILGYQITKNNNNDDSKLKWNKIWVVKYNTSYDTCIKHILNCSHGIWYIFKNENGNNYNGKFEENVTNKIFEEIIPLNNKGKLKITKQLIN